jgi:chemotaxis protein CheC
MNITHDQIDALKELINIGVGRAAGVLSSMIQCRISLQVPSVRTLTLSELSEEAACVGNGRLSTVKLGFRGPFAGTAALIFPPDSASKLVSLLVSEEPDFPDLDSVRAGTLNEVGSIVINSVMGSISNVLRQRLDYSLPAYIEDSFEHLLRNDILEDEIMVLLANTHFTVEQCMIEGNIILIFESTSFGTLLSAIDGDIMLNQT